MSTYWDGRLFQNTATHENVDSYIICHDNPSVQALFNMCKLFYERLPEDIRPMRRYWAKRNLVFENPDDEGRILDPGLRSSIQVSSAKSTKFGRAPTIHNLHFSEGAHYPPNSEEIKDGALNAVPEVSGTMIVDETTANGAQGQFFEEWKMSERGQNYFLPIFLPWHIFPLYRVPGAKIRKTDLYKDELSLVKKFGVSGEQLSWRRRTIKNKCRGKVEIFKQEYPSEPDEAFIYSGTNVFPGAVIEWYRENTVREPRLVGTLWYGSKGAHELLSLERGSIPKIYETTDDRELLIKFYEFPKKGRSYAIGVDSSEGLEAGDPAAIVVIDDAGCEVASHVSKADPTALAVLALKLGTFYNQGLIIPEANNHGGTVIQKMLEIGYANLYRRESHDSLKKTVTKKVGWFNNEVTKLLLVNFLRDAAEEFIIAIRTKEILDEMAGFIKKPSGVYEGRPDDMISALSLALYAMKDELSPLFERQKFHQILGISPEKAELLQNALRGEVEYLPGSIGYTDKIMKEVEEDNDGMFDGEMFTQYYAGFHDWPATLGDWSDGS